jgi:hypothetical protein
MESEKNKVSEVKNSNKEISDWNVIQDFNNKKANSHATIFVASMFALFTVLSLAQRIVSKESFSCSNYIVLILSLVSYILIWFFGFYSILNFSFYSTVSQRAEERIIGNTERQLIMIERKKWKGILRIFSNYKVPDYDEGQGLVGKTISSPVNKNLEIFVIIYVIIGFLPLVAFLIWFFG